MTTVEQGRNALILLTRVQVCAKLKRKELDCRYRKILNPLTYQFHFSEFNLRE